MFEVKRIISVFIALLFAAVFAVPNMAAVAAEGEFVPEGYDAHDYLLVREFLEIRDCEGVRNGEKLNAGYDPDDPATWVYAPWSGHITNVAAWNIDEPRRLTSFHVGYLPLTGALTLSGCEALKTVSMEYTAMTALDVSGCGVLNEVACIGGGISELSLEGCTALKWLDLTGNDIEGIELVGFPKLQFAYLDDNRITRIALGDCPLLRDLRIANNLLTELDVSGLDELRKLNINGNLLSEIDVSANTKLNLIAACGNSFRRIDMNACSTRLSEVKGIGEGTVGYESFYYELVSETPQTNYVHAVPAEGYRFVGWYNDRGELVSEEADFGGFSSAGYEDIDGHLEYVITHDPLELSGETFMAARFVPEGEAFLLGDCDAGGEVDTTDALLTLRCALGIFEYGDDMLVRCDINANGVIDTADALLILRMTLGVS